MNLLQAALDVLNSPPNLKRECTLIVTTFATTFEGAFLAASNGTLQIAVYGSRGDGTTGPTGNDLLIPEREIRMIEIDWADTYGTCNT